ncbi:hypothetical protein V7S43_010699 [Phytophthora oleae]|uniref:RxLR effector protein n=1 Tax=Phytophthora oleae TaxID=2107226 RepID=A0ABD3FF99_9STRA
MRLSFILLAITVALVACVDAAVAIESSKRIRSEESGRHLKEKKTGVKTKLSAADLTKEERASGLIAWMMFQGGKSRKALDKAEETVRYGRNRIHKPLRFESRVDGMYVISEKNYQAKLAHAVAEAAKTAKNDEELAKKVKLLMKKFQ